MIKKSPWVSLVNCSGCITGDTELILGNGEILTAKDLVENKLNGNIFNEISKNEVLGCSVKGSILSFNKSPEMIDVVSAYKIKSPKKILRIKTVTSNLKLTKNHKVLVDTLDGKRWKKTEDLEIGDYVFSPKKIKIKPKIFSILESVDDNWGVELEGEFLNHLKEELKKEFGNLKNASKELKIEHRRLVQKRSKLHLGHLKKIVESIDESLDDYESGILRFSKRGYYQDFKKKRPDADLMYVLGLIESDGYITSRKKLIHKICFDNTEKKLIDIFIEKTKPWVGNSKVSYYISKKQPSLYRAYTYSRYFTDICKFFGIKTSKEEVSDLSKIFQLPEDLISAFIAGYFDGDGCPVMMEPRKRGKKPRIMLEFAIKEKKTAKQIQLLLKRLGIISKISPCRNKSSFGFRIMHRVRITFHDEILKFVDKIPIKHPEKIKKFSKIKQILSEHKRKQSKLNQAPMRCNFLIRKIRDLNNLRREDVFEPTFLSMIENGKRIQKHTVKRLIKSFHKLGVKSKDLEELEELVSEDFYLDPIKKIKEVDSKDKFVYDFTVKGTHCYIPSGGFLISNCNGCAISCLPLITPKYDVERFGVQLKPSVRHADILLVTGPTNEKTKHTLKRIYDQTPKQKKVIAVGNCAISRCVFKDAYNAKQTVDEVVPVDMYIPGCPPITEAIVYGIVKLLGGADKGKKTKT